MGRLRNRAAFGYAEWLAQAQADTSSTTTMVFTNPASTLLFEVVLRSATTGDKIAVWWDDGSYNNYTLSSSADTTVGHTYAAAATRTIVVVGADRVRQLTSTQTDGRSNFGGDVTTWTWLTSLTVTGSNTVSGSVAGLTSLTKLSVTGSNTVSGSVAGLTSLTKLSVTGSNALSGSVAGLTGLTYLNLGGSNTCTGFDTVAAAATKLAYIKMNNALSEAVVNAILAGFWANRDVAKTSTDRTIDLNDNAGSAAPSGQGIIDKAALAAYVSPPGSTVWTVSTN